MTLLDWFIIAAINGAIIAYGLVRARQTVRSVDWFLAARSLPWWIVGLSMFATALDAGDYVALAGRAYSGGLVHITGWWLGLTTAWLAVAYFFFLPMYRTGVYTNAEYLEYRFGPAARVLSVLIQFQFRTNVLANISFSLYLTFSILTGWGTATWWLIGLIALGAATYTATGGLRSVVVTDAMQSVMMVIAAFALWLIVWNAVGGWTGLETKLESVTPGLSDTMMHVGGASEPGVPAILIVVGWMIVLLAYCVVNHSQSMRMLAARSEWDMKMAAVVAGVVTAVVGWLCVTIGVLGKAIFPELEMVDEVYPRLLQRYVGPGLIGVVVAGLLAGGISTYDSVGSALSAVFTRDLYARFLVTDCDDRHYLRVSRIFTFVMIAASFAYIPLLKEGMVEFYLELTRVAVTPLFTVYMMGTLTRVHRASGSVGLVAGIVCGLTSFFGERLDWPLPLWWTNTWWAYLWSIAVPAVAMVVTSVIRGWATHEEMRGLVYSPVGVQDATLPSDRTAAAPTTWLAATRAEMPPMPRYSFPVPARGLPWYRRSALWGWMLLVIMALLNLVIFW